MRTNNEIAAGEHFKYRGMEFVVLDLDIESKVLFAISASIVKTMAFSDSDEPGSNDWRKSKIRRWLNEKYIKHFNPDDLVPIASDLTADNGDDEYGTSTDYLALLSCDLYRKYRKLTPSYSDWIWTLSPWVCRSPYPSDAYITRDINPSGALSNHYSTSANGVAPTCTFNLNSLELRRQAQDLPELYNPNDVKFEEDDSTLDVNMIKTADSTVINLAEVAACDEFICSGCGIRLEGWSRVEIDEENWDTAKYEYEFKFCPECGKQVRDE